VLGPTRARRTPGSPASFRSSTPGAVPSHVPKWSRTRPGSAWTMRVLAGAEMPATRGRLGRRLGLAVLRLLRRWFPSGPRLTQVCGLRCDVLRLFPDSGNSATQAIPQDGCVGRESPLKVGDEVVCAVYQRPVPRLPLWCAALWCAAFWRGALFRLARPFETATRSGQRTAEALAQCLGTSRHGPPCRFVLYDGHRSFSPISGPSAFTRSGRPAARTGRLAGFTVLRLTRFRCTDFELTTLCAFSNPAVSAGATNSSHEPGRGVPGCEHASHSVHQATPQRAPHLGRKHNGGCGDCHTHRAFSKVLDFHMTAPQRSISPVEPFRPFDGSPTFSVGSPVSSRRVTMASGETSACPSRRSQGGGSGRRGPSASSIAEIRGG